MTSVGSAISVSESRPAMTSIMVINPGSVPTSALVTSIAVFIEVTSILKSIRIELVELSITRRRRLTKGVPARSSREVPRRVRKTQPPQPRLALPRCGRWRACQHPCLPSPRACRISTQATHGAATKCWKFCARRHGIGLMNVSSSRQWERCVKRATCRVRMVRSLTRMPQSAAALRGT